MKTKLREIVVISGKGGTGKTSLTAAFAHLGSPAMLCDLDVDAPDLHLLLDPVRRETHDFRSGHVASIDPDACIQCGSCEEFCRFGAVRCEQPAGGIWSDAVYRVDPMRCEGCKVCVQFCPAGAVKFESKLCGRWHASTTRFGPLVHAQLYPGEANSGRLVALLKNEARKRAEAAGLSTVICDGSPGIGCPVISSLSGASLAVVVTEPTPSGLHDLIRVADLCTHFRVPVAVIVNKFDLNVGQTNAIAAHCDANGHALVGRLPNDDFVVYAMMQGKAVTELPETPFTVALRGVWERIDALASPRPSRLRLGIEA